LGGMNGGTESKKEARANEGDLERGKKAEEREVARMSNARDQSVLFKQSVLIRDIGAGLCRTCLPYTSSSRPHFTITSAGPIPP
jgi:hypothetical protein